jgi:hypothetical protein
LRRRLWCTPSSFDTKKGEDSFQAVTAASVNNYGIPDLVRDANKKGAATVQKPLVSHTGETIDVSSKAVNSSPDTPSALIPLHTCSEGRDRRGGAAHAEAARTKGHGLLLRLAALAGVSGRLCALARWCLDPLSLP